MPADLDAKSCLRCGRQFQADYTGWLGTGPNRTVAFFGPPSITRMASSGTPDDVSKAFKAHQRKVAMWIWAPAASVFALCAFAGCFAPSGLTKAELAATAQEKATHGQECPVQITGSEQGQDGAYYVSGLVTLKGRETSTHFECRVSGSSVECHDGPD
jgi:hypothetical protein